MPTCQIYGRKTVLLIMFGALMLIRGSESFASDVFWPLKVSSNGRYLTRTAEEGYGSSIRQMTTVINCTHLGKTY